MASMIKKNGNAMADEDDAEERAEESERAKQGESGDDDRDDGNRNALGGGKQPAAEPRPAAPSGARGGFFSIYKSGQGYWTRMGTAAGAGIILIATLIWLYQYLPVWLLPAF